MPPVRTVRGDGHEIVAPQTHDAGGRRTTLSVQPVEMELLPFLANRCMSRITNGQFGLIHYVLDCEGVEMLIACASFAVTAGVETNPLPLTYTTLNP